LQGSAATTVADRGASFSSALSPNEHPRLKIKQTLLHLVKITSSDVIYVDSINENINLSVEQDIK